MNDGRGREVIGKRRGEKGRKEKQKMILYVITWISKEHMRAGGIAQW